MVQYYCSLFVNAYKIAIEWQWFLCAHIVYQFTLVVARKKSGSDSCAFLCHTPCMNIVILATKAVRVIITGSGNQSPGPGQSAPNSVVSGNGTTLVLNSAATSPATSPTITSQQAAIGGVNGSLSSSTCPPHVTSTLVTLPPPTAPPPNPRPPPPLPPRRPREHPLIDSNPPQQVTYMLVSDRKSYLIQSFEFLSCFLQSLQYPFVGLRVMKLVNFSSVPLFWDLTLCFWVMTLIFICSKAAWWSHLQQSEWIL